ncbi:hypothetical protein ANN_11089 [Periplaneta americana]|uniref:CBM20 domain-containing protein n=1 Tax=Periplaneta americana TaxID=6978 RepID=A0ABQ8T421_PERAM|nr:hypothetical protein ANN_11089 [Periplaneta americana]
MKGERKDWKFRVTVNTLLRETVFVVGSCRELGSWNSSGALQLTCENASSNDGIFLGCKRESEKQREVTTFIFPKKNCKHGMMGLSTIKDSGRNLSPHLDVQAEDAGEGHIMKQRKLSIGTWNVRTLLQACKLENLKEEVRRNKVDVMGISEVRETVWSAVISIPSDCDVQFRYFVGILFEPDEEKYPSRQVVVRRWETNLNPRLIRKEVCSNNHQDVEPDIFGLYDSGKMIDRGWLTSETVVQFKLVEDAIQLWKQKFQGREVYVKLTPMLLSRKKTFPEFTPSSDVFEESMDTQDVAEPLDRWPITEISVMNKDEWEFRLQDQFGHVYNPEDCIIFNVSMHFPEAVSMFTYSLGPKLLIASVININDKDALGKETTVSDGNAVNSPSGYFAARTGFHCDFISIIVCLFQAYMMDYYIYSSRTAEGEPPYHVGFSYILPSMLTSSEGQAIVSITSNRHRAIGQLRC